MKNEEITAIYENMRKDYEYTKEIDFTEVNKVFGLAKKYRQALKDIEYHTQSSSWGIAKEALKENHATP